MRPSLAPTPSAAAGVNQRRQRARLSALWRGLVLSAPAISYAAGGGVAIYALRDRAWWVLALLAIAAVATTISAVDVMFRRRTPPRVVGTDQGEIFLRRAGERDTRVALPQGVRERLHAAS